MTNAVMVMALLVAPMSALVGVAIGAFFTHRLMRGQSPIPPIPRQAKAIEEQPTTQNGKQRVHPPT